MKKLWYIGLLVCLLNLVMFSAVTKAAELATIDGIRISSSADKVRIVIDSDQEVDYQSFMLREPQRVVIDLKNAKLGNDVKREYTVSSKYIEKLRLSQFDANNVRIVADTQIDPQGYDVFSLAGGKSAYRVILDLTTPKTSATSKPAVKTPAAVSKPVAKPVVKPVVAKPVVKPAATATTKAIELPNIAFAITAADKVALAGKKITIDPGHGGSDSGAVGVTGLMEKEVTIKVGLGLAELLKQSGAKVYITRKGDNDVAPQPATDVEELQARVDVANNVDSDIFISIHLDSFSSAGAKGTSGWYYEKAGNDSRRLADAVKRGVVSQLGLLDRGTKGSNFYVIKHTNMPATLVELAFLSNPKEEALMRTPEGVRKATIGIYKGIVEYFSQK